MALRILIIFACLSFASELFAYDIGKQYKITVLHTNDHHGAFWPNSMGEYGMAARMSLINQIRTEVEGKGGLVLLLSGGDINTGTPESEMSDATPDFLGMNAMKYDAMTVGNHEFDKEFEVLLKQKALAQFPFLAANIFNKGTLDRPFPAKLEIQKNGLKIAIVGFTTDQTPQQSIRFPHNKLEMRSPIDVAKKIIPQIRKTSDLVIGLTHMGHYPDAERGSRSPGDETLAREVKGFDLIIGGHTQIPMFIVDHKNGTYIAQAGEWGKHVGRIDFIFKDGELKLISNRLIPVNLKDDNGQFLDKKIEENKDLREQLIPYKLATEQTTSHIVGVLKGKLEGHRSIIRKQETNLGNFVSYLMAKNTDSDVAIVNSGVIRNSLEPGKVTYGDILRVHPNAFSLKYAYVTLTGRELWDHLAVVAFKSSGAFPQFYGLKISVKDNKLDSIFIKDKGSSQFLPLILSKSYRVAMTDFMARGGDGYPVMENHESFVETNIVDAEAMKSYFEANKEVDANTFSPIGNLKIWRDDSFAEIQKQQP